MFRFQMTDRIPFAPLAVRTIAGITLFNPSQGNREKTMSIIWMLVVGLVVGAIAKLMMPGKDPGGIFVTMLLGVAGARASTGFRRIPARPKLVGESFSKTSGPSSIWDIAILDPPSEY